MINCKLVNTPIASSAIAFIIPFNRVILKKEIEEYGLVIGSLNYLAY
jgi:hypothetical protein